MQAAPRASAGATPRAFVVCVDVGSTFTKAVAIGADGAVRAIAQHPTTSGTDVPAGLDSAVAGLGVGRVPPLPRPACPAGKWGHAGI